MSINIATFVANINLIIYATIVAILFCCDKMRPCTTTKDDDNVWNTSWQ